MYKMHGRFNWSLTQTLHRARRMNNGMFGSGRGAEPLLALAPWVPLHKVSSLEQYNDVVGGLMKAAFVLGRTAVIPDLPVTLPWLHKGGQGAGEAKVAEGGGGRRRQAQETQAPADQPLQVVKVTQKELQDLAAAANVKDQPLVYLGHPVDMFEALPDANAQDAFIKNIWPKCTSRW
ncbi:hypothetical protein HaLaN_22741 [Haematococcus lacustris]|uniref:Uncharacterized protein n=1 Tax=Haematococcus lacustris TaxID=44745 RepID=A0A699ZRB8_HAELA|nr:hypothetical protein HaLaN_22741 [Haematococcus lacustris]